MTATICGLVTANGAVTLPGATAVSGEGIAPGAGAAANFVCPISAGASACVISFSATQATPFKINPHVIGGATTATTVPAASTWLNGMVVQCPANSSLVVAADGDNRLAGISVWVITAATVYVSWIK